MSQIFNLPDVGEGLTEAEILTWKVSVGSEVSINDVLVEIETAKSVVELPSPYTGTVEKILVSEGETVEVGTPIIAISGSAASTADEPQDAPAASADEGESGNQALVGSGPKADSVKRRARKRPASARAQNAADPGIARSGDAGGAYPLVTRAAQSGAFQRACRTRLQIRGKQPVQYGGAAFPRRG